MCTETCEAFIYKMMKRRWTDVILAPAYISVALDAVGRAFGNSLRNYCSTYLSLEKLVPTLHLAHELRGLMIG